LKVLPGAVRSRSGRGVAEGVGEQRLEGAELHTRLLNDVVIGAVECSSGETRLAVDEFGDLGVDGVRGEDAPRGDGHFLADAVHTIDGLGLLCAGPGKFGENDVGGDLQVEADPGGGE